VGELGLGVDRKQTIYSQICEKAKNLSSSSKVLKLVRPSSTTCCTSTTYSHTSRFVVDFTWEFWTCSRFAINFWSTLDSFYMCRKSTRNQTKWSLDCTLYWC